MKNGFKRLISLLLSLILTLSAVPVFVYADESTTEEETDSSPSLDYEGGEQESTMPENFKLYYSRNFSEGWPLTNGLSVSMKNHAATLDYERGYDGGYNYFGRVTALGSGDGFMQYDWPRSQTADSYVIEFDIKADDYAHFATPIFYVRTIGGNGPGAIFYLLTISNNALYYYNYKYEAEQPGDAIPDPDSGEPKAKETISYNGSTKMFDLTNEWTKISFVFDYSNPGIRGKEFTLTINWQTPDGEKHSVTQLLRSNIDWKVDEDGEYVLENGECIDTNKHNPRLDIMRLGFAGGPASTEYGASYCFDNMRMYEGTTESFFEIDEAWGLKNGSSVNSEQKPTIEIKGNDDLEVVTDKMIAMKVGVDYCLNGDVREPIFTAKDDYGNETAYGAPVKVDGKVYVPIMKLLEATGLPYYMHKDGQSLDITTGQSVSYITLGKINATVNGEKVTLTAAPGYYEDDNGNRYLAIGLDDVETIFPDWYITYDDLGLIIFAQEDEVYNRKDDLAEMRDLMGKFVFEFKTGDEVYADVQAQTNNFDHPYLIANQDKFDELRDIYYAEEGDANYNSLIHEAVDKMIRNANSYYKGWAQSSSVELNSKGEEVEVYDEYVGLLTDREIDEKNGNGNFLNTVMHGGGRGGTGTHNGNSLYQPYIYPGAEYVEAAIDEGNSSNKVYRIGDGGWITGYDNDATYVYTYSNKTYTFVGHYFTNPGYERCISEDYDGYDPAGGRTDIGVRMEYVMKMAFAYQITGDDKYLLCAYDVALRLGQWYSWSPGHFLDNATATLYFSYFYDWCYDRINELGEQGVISEINGKPLSTELLAQILYKHGVYAGYRAVTGQGVVAHASRNQGNITSFCKQYNNWNAVCSSGMVAGALALMNHTDIELIPEIMNPESESTALKDDVRAQTLDLFVRCFKGMAEVGLDQYAPDGSYSEGMSYWSFGTGRVFVLLTLLVNSCGTDYGMFDAPGLDRTCQYAYSGSSSDYMMFPYSDGGHGRMGFDHFFFMGKYLDQQELINVRMAQLTRFPEEVNYYDALYFPLDAEAKKPTTLDYYSAGIDMFTARASWEDGALFAGVLGGKNKTADHNQIDAGAFIYYNNNVSWFIDIGTENYNVYGFGKYETKYRYYKVKPEGNNTICITTDQKNVPFGQVYDSEAFAYEYMIEDNPHGAYAKFDMTETLGPTCNYWKRGILVTNDRQTTVIQDEISLNTTANLYWSAHFSIAKGYVDEYTLADGGRTAYLINYGAESGSTSNFDKTDDKYLRVTLVANSSKLKFEFWNTYTFVHSSAQSPDDPGFTHKNNYNPDYYTVGPNWSEEMGGQYEGNRNNYRKLVVRAEQDISLEMAVVIEAVDADPAQRYAVGYSWQYMDGSATYGPWEPTADNRYKADYVPDSDALDRSKYKLSIYKDIGKYLDMVTKADNINTYLTLNYEEFFRFLASAQYLSVKYKDQIATVSTYKEANESFLSTLEIFNMYRAEFVSVQNSRDEVCKSLLGVTIEND